MVFERPGVVTGQHFLGVGLKLKALILTFRGLSSHVCQKMMRVAGQGDLECESFSGLGILQNHFLRGFENEGAAAFFLQNINFQNKIFRPFEMSSY